MPDDDKTKAEQIAALRAQLAELEGTAGERPLLTLAEIKALSKEDIDRDFAHVQQSLAALGDTSAGSRGDASQRPARPHEDDVQATGVDRIAKAYANSGDGGQQ
jgi:hypothetical protein